MAILDNTQTRFLIDILRREGTSDGLHMLDWHVCSRNHAVGNPDDSRSYYVAYTRVFGLRMKEAHFLGCEQCWNETRGMLTRADPPRIKGWVLIETAIPT